MVKVSFDKLEKYEETQERVVFHARVDDRQLRCLISRRTLEEHFTILGGPHMRVENCLHIFARNRSAIHDSARRLIGEMGASDLAAATELVLSPSFL